MDGTKTGRQDGIDHGGGTGHWARYYGVVRGAGRARDHNRHPHRESLEGKPFDVRKLDVRDTQAINALAQEIGSIDVLFNCAGFVHAGSILEASEEDWDFAFDQRQGHVSYDSRVFAEDAGAGRRFNHQHVVVGIEREGVPNRFVYSASKAAVIGLTKAVAADFVTRGIRCNAICPGTVESPSLKERIAEQAKTQGASVDQIQAVFVARQWGASAARRKSPISRCIWAPTNRRSRPDRFTSSTAAGRTKRTDQPLFSTSK